MFAECERSAASGGGQLCGRHGGGKRCSHVGCEKMARPGFTQGLLCAAHGGGKRCEHPGCVKSARAGNEQRCAAHGGGQRCAVDGCVKSAPDSNNPFCVAHGGGKRCKEVGCTRSAASGGEGKNCIRHGGGRRCGVSECDKGAIHGSNLCISHGGKRSLVVGSSSDCDGDKRGGGEVRDLPLRRDLTLPKAPSPPPTVLLPWRLQAFYECSTRWRTYYLYPYSGALP